MNENIRENLRFFKNISDEEIWNVLKRLNLHVKIQNLKDGLDTKLRLEDLPFSQGEKQLFILAQAILKKPKLVLCDEATSYLDIKAEHHFMDKLKSFFPNATIIMIAHRLKTLQFVDEIFVLDSGKLKKTIYNNEKRMITKEELL